MVSKNFLKISGVGLFFSILVDPFLSSQAMEEETLERAQVQVESLNRELIGALEELEKRVQARKEISPRKRAILILGPTGDGKSTLTTLLAGGHTTAQRNARGQLVIDGKVNEEIVIGHSQRGTLLPSSVYLEPQDSIIWDCPGFGDIRGPEKDIVNGASISRLVNAFSTMKILLVLSEKRLDLIRDKGVLDLFNHLTESFANLEQLKIMTSLVITSKGQDFDPLVALDEYCEDKENTLTTKAREFLRYLLSNKEQSISYVTRPSAIGPYLPDIGKIWGVVDGTQYVGGPDFAIALSDAAQGYLLPLSLHLNQTIAQCLEEAREEIIGSFKDQIRHFRGDRIEELERLVKERIGVVERLRGLQQEDNIEDISRIEGISIETSKALRSKLAQLKTLRTLGRQRVSYDIGRWYVPLSPISTITLQPEEWRREDQDDINHSSIPTYTYKMDVNGLRIVLGEVKLQRNACPHQELRRSIRIMEGTFNRGSSSVNIQEEITYRRPNGSEYTSSLVRESISTIQKPAEWREIDYDDRALQAIPTYRHFVSLDGQEVFVGEVKGNPQPYTERNIREVMGFNVPGESKKLGPDGIIYSRKFKYFTFKRPDNSRGERLAETMVIQEYPSFVSQYAAGSQHGGGAAWCFRNPTSLAIKGVLVKSGQYVDGIQFILENRSVSSHFGGNGGGLDTIEFAPGERLVGIFGRCGALIDAIGFITRTGGRERRYGPYGGSGGGPFEYNGVGEILEMSGYSEWFGGKYILKLINIKALTVSIERGILDSSASAIINRLDAEAQEQRIQRERARQDAAAQAEALERSYREQRARIEEGERYRRAIEAMTSQRESNRTPTRQRLSPSTGARPSSSAEDAKRSQSPGTRRAQSPGRRVNFGTSQP